MGESTNGGVAGVADDGFSLVELMVAVVIFGVFLTILVTSIVGVTRASTRASVIANTATGALSVFQGMDRQIRYADSINYPGKSGTGASYVEFRTPASSSSTGVTICTQYRFVPTTQVIQSRTWPDVAGATATPWITGVSNIVDDGGAFYPFRLIAATNAGSQMQQLVLTIDGGNSPIAGAAISTTFVARNSSIQSPSNASANTANTSDTPVCLSDLGSGARP